MYLGDPWDDSYLQQQHKLQFSVRFVYQYPVTNQNIPGINTMDLDAP